MIQEVQDAPQKNTQTNTEFFAKKMSYLNFNLTYYEHVYTENDWEYRGRYSDPENDVLSFSVRMKDGTELPSWLTLSSLDKGIELPEYLDEIGSTGSIPVDAEDKIELILDISSTGNDGKRVFSDDIVIHLENVQQPGDDFLTFMKIIHWPFLVKIFW